MRRATDLYTVTRRSNDVPYALVHATAILGTTIAVYGALGIALSPIIGPIPGVTFSRVVGGLVFAFGVSLTLWGLTTERGVRR